MARAPRGTYVKGASKLRRKLSRIEPAAREEIKVVLKEGGERIAATARAFAPVDSGTLRSSIKYRVFSKGMQVKAGIITAAAKRAAWYAHFVEFGTRGGVFRAAKVAKNAIGNALGRRRQIKTFYEINMPARSAQPFIQPAGDIELPRVREEAKAAVQRALRIAMGDASGRSGSGAGGDIGGSPGGD